MTNRELLLDTLNGRKTPRVPVAPFIFNNIVNEFRKGPPGDPLEECIALYKRFGFDIILRNYFVHDYINEEVRSCEHWKVEKAVIDLGDGNWDEKTTITTPEREMSQLKSYRCVSSNETVEAITEYYIKSHEDFEQFKKYQPPIAQSDCSCITQARKLLGEDGITGPWMHGVFNIAGTYRELSDLVLDAYVDGDFYIEMMEYFYDRAIIFVRQLIKAGPDFICMAGNMASGSIVGPKMFKDHVMSYEKRMIAEIHKEDIKIIYHNCGDMKYLLPMYAEMGIDMLESLAAPPFGDIELEDAFREIPPPVVLSGGVDQIDFLRKARPDEVRTRVKDVLNRVKGRGGFILAASDYFCEGTPEENIIAFAQAGRDHGSY